LHPGWLGPDNCYTTAFSVRHSGNIAEEFMLQTPSMEPIPADPYGDTRDRLRIVLCVDSLAAAGTELNAVRTAEQLRLRGHAASLLVLRPGGALVARCHESGVPVTAFPIPSIRSAGIVTRGLTLARLFRDEGVDIVHTQDRYTNTFVVPWARLAGRRVIASRRWWDVHPSRGIRAGNRVAFRLAHRIVANSERVAELVHDVDGVARHRIAVIPNFLDEWALRELGPEDRGHLRRQLGVPQDARVIGCVANLRPVKAHGVLLDAMAAVIAQWPDVVLALVGDGESRSTLEAQARRLGIADRVVFAGSRSDPVNWHHAFDISVLTSSSEGFPNTVVEAMAAANPVVATDVGGTPDAVRHGRNGLLVPAGAAEPIAAALGSLLADPATAAAMGRRGRDEALVRFRASAVIPKLERLYFSALTNHRGVQRA
jgi:glycosyltransferase involved in cell wall biosynthesis